MSKEFVSEIQIPIEQQTIMDSNVSSSVEIKEKVLDSKENQNPEQKGVEITVIDKEVVKEGEVISRGFEAKPNSEEENQEIFSKGLMEESVNDSAKEVCCQVQDSMPIMSQFVNSTPEMDSETSFECQDSSSNEKVFQVQDVITDDDRMIFVIDRPDFVVPDSLLASQNPVEKAMIGSDESDCGVWGESSASGSKEMVAEIETDNVNGIGSIGLGKKCSKRKFTETNLKKNVLSMFAEATSGFEKKLDGSKRRYTRNEMEALRVENSYLQRQIWREIYTGLGPIIAKELNCSAEDRQKSNANTAKRKQRRRKPKQHNQHLQQSQENHQYQQQHQKHPQKPHQQAGVSAENASIIGCSQIMELNMEECSLAEEYSQIMDNTVVVCDDHDDGSTYYENEESDDEYDSIKRPAFYVEGDPDFDSGPPEDGLEYLRRVRYEAAQIPNVKVVKVDKSKLDKEQTKYMPEIPDIAKCPPHLQPSKEWEDAFLADFSELRQALPHLEGSKTFQPMSVADVDDASRCSRDPTVSVILGLDDVARVSMLKRCINSFETKSSLCRNDCAWLFALFVAVGIPLNADTTASVRSLLRKCASLRAGKLEAGEDDDEVVMLNMLATICGRFFGQLD
ncbi:uncharacterized protein LOC113316051 isoform X1 [Papaver somniferum]|uniref:uncharacterized protein LOC113316051 isoform X1 n=2 Tax=Papaver somniferum TaxID=3469 RepID=UPI000E6FD4FE|nr:uncharacterized protein LOC113316051 isoform X1 [Papaver somniferum]